MEGSFKLIVAPRRELYDLARDPGERLNLLAEDGERASALETWVRQLAGSAEAAPAAAPSIDPRLRSLGYVAAGATSRTSSSEDPKDRLPTYVRFTAASRALEQGRPKEALPVLDQLVAETDTAGVRFQRAAALRMLGRFDDAFSDLEKVAATDPSYPGLHLELMRNAVGKSDWGRVREECDLALREDPSACEALLYRGAAGELRGDIAAAEADYRAALKINPAFGRASLRLAALLVRANRLDEARVVLKTHLARHPGDQLAEGLLGSI